MGEVIMIAIAAPTGSVSQAAQSAGIKTLSDEKLIGRIAQGDPLAMRLLFSRHRNGVQKFVRRFVRSEATAEDLVSEVFLDVWRGAAAGYQARATVSTWLMAIARFKAMSELRRRTEVALDVETAERVADQSADPEVALQENNRNHAFRRCLAGLSPEHGQVIDLVYYQDKSVKEVAEFVGISVPTVKTRMFYARKRLAELFKAA
jgi:RNA polymerase sigma-70 factor, ECF subfamily